MSIAAIKMIQAEIREKLSARITVDAMDAVQDALADVLARYEIGMPAAGSGGPDYALQAYLDAMAVEGRSQKTVERYRYVLERLFFRMPDGHAEHYRIPYPPLFCRRKGAGNSGQHDQGHPGGLQCLFRLVPARGPDQ